jgi:hypothetical protein
MIFDANLLQQIILVALVMWFVFWKAPKNRWSGAFLYLIAAPMLWIFGFNWGQRYQVQGIVIVVLGFYCLFMAGKKVFSENS